MMKWCNAILTSVLMTISTTSHGFFHLWEFTEIYSNADGSVQYIEMFTPDDNQQFIATFYMDSFSSDYSQLNTYVFPTQAPSPTGGHYMLLATNGFAALSGGVTPDFILPDGYLFSDGGILDFPAVDYMTYGFLPDDGLHAVDRFGDVVLGTPTNYAGEVGSLIAAPIPATVWLFGSGLLGLTGLARHKKT